MTSWRTRHSYLARKFGHFFLLLRTFRAERGLAIVGALSLAGLALMQFVCVERQNRRSRYDRGTARMPAQIAGIYTAPAGIAIPSRPSGHGTAMELPCFG
jgi:hypothetical protein